MVKVQETARNGRRLVTVALMMATFLSALDLTVVATAMPTVIGQLGGLEIYAWVFSAYLLSSTVTVPIYGRLADIFGRKPLFISAVLFFLVGSALCGLAQSMEQLVVFRLIQGLGAGGVMSLTLTIIGDIYPLEDRARVNGLYSLVWGVAALCGPAVGGFVTEQISWRWAFYVNLPFCLLSMFMVWLWLHEKVVRREHRIDWVGALLLVGAVSALLFGLRNPAAEGGSEISVPLLALSVALTAAFLWQEAHTAEPMVPLHLFRDRVIGVSTLGMFIVGGVIYGQNVFVAPFLQGVLGASPTVSGFMLACTSLGWSSSQALCGQAIMRWGYRAVGVVGSLFLVAGTTLLLTLQPGDSLVRGIMPQVVMGAGFGLVTVVLTVAVQNAVPWRRRGTVTGATQFSRTISGTVMVSIAGAVFAAAATGGPVDPNALLNPDLSSTLDPATVAQLREVLSNALRPVYVMFVMLAVGTLATSAFLPGGDPEKLVYREPEEQSPPAEAVATRPEPVGAGR